MADQFVILISSTVDGVYTVSKNTLGVKKVAWPRKTASTTKRTDMGLWPRSICNHNTPCKIWDKKVANQKL